MRKLLSLALAAAALAASAGHASAFTISDSYYDLTDGSGTTLVGWTADEEAVVKSAISSWTSRLSISGPVQNVDVAFQFVDDGPAELAEWVGQPGPAPESVTSPDVHDVINVNTYYLNQALANPMVFTLGAVAFNQYDALTAIRHELGHAMGWNTIYTDINGASLWSQHVGLVGGNAVFDPGGLNIALYDPTNTVHTADGPDLMAAHLFNGQRKDISDADLNALALAYGYTVLPAPEPASLALLGTACGLILARRRRRPCANHRSR